MSDEPESLMLQLLRQMRAEIGDVKEGVVGIKSDVSALKNDVKDIKSDMRSLRADVASDLLVHRKEMGDQIVGLRRAVMEYHTSASATAF